MMEHKNDIIIVYNPCSTQASRVGRDVFDVLDANGVGYEKYVTKSPDTEENIADMRAFLPDKDATVISSAGDGTYAQLVNAIARGKKAITLGSIPMGNFNDVARSDRSQSVMDILGAKTTELTPLTIAIDGEYWRHAPAYMTLGWTAVAAARFDGTGSRESMKRLPQQLKLLKSLGQLASSYFNDRQTMLPAFQVDNSPDLQRHATDVLVANSSRVGRIVRMPVDYSLSADSFGVNTDIDVSRILPNISFGLRALTGHTPHRCVGQLRLTFEQTSRLPIQTEGEVAWVQANEIVVYKNPGDVMNVLDPRL